MPSNVAWFERLTYGALLLSLVSGYFVTQGGFTAAADDIGLPNNVLFGLVVAMMSCEAIERITYSPEVMALVR